MAHRRGGQARQGKLRGHREADQFARALDFELASEPGGMPLSSGTQGNLDVFETTSRRLGESRAINKARGQRRREVKRNPNKALRRQRHVEARRLLRGSPSDRRSGLKPDASREGRF